MQAKAVIKDYIVFCDGEARIVGKEHLKAELVARRHVEGGNTIEEVMAHYPLTRAQVYAALAYFYENEDDLNREYDRWFNEARQQGMKLDRELRAEIARRAKKSSSD